MVVTYSFERPSSIDIFTKSSFFTISAHTFVVITVFIKILINNVNINSLYLIYFYLTFNIIYLLHMNLYANKLIITFNIYIILSQNKPNLYKIIQNIFFLKEKDILVCKNYTNISSKYNKFK